MAIQRYKPDDPGELSVMIQDGRIAFRRIRPGDLGIFRKDSGIGDDVKEAFMRAILNYQSIETPKYPWEVIQGEPEFEFHCLKNPNPYGLEIGYRRFKVADGMTLVQRNKVYLLSSGRQMAWQEAQMISIGVMTLAHGVGANQGGTT